MCNLVELHGGTVRAESEGEGKGAALAVKSPLAVESEIPNSSKYTEEDITADPLDLSGLRILVVDDDPDKLEILNLC